VAKADMEKYVSGKRFLPVLGVGCLLFAAVMGFGTYSCANVMTPWLKKRNAEAQQRAKAEQQKSGQTAPLTTPN